MRTTEVATMPQIIGLRAEDNLVLNAARVGIG